MSGFPVPGRIGRAVLSALGAVLLALLFATPAFGWNVSNPDADIVRITRSAEDSGAATWLVYTTGAYPAAAQYSSGSYDATGSGSAFGTNPPVYTIQMDADANSAELAIGNGPTMVLVVGPGGRHQLISTTARWARAPQGVYVAGQSGSAIPTYLTSGPATTAPVGAQAVSVVGTVPVSNTASLSVAGTLPVDPWGTSPVSRDALAVGFAFVMVGLGLHGSGKLGKLVRRVRL